MTETTAISLEIIFKGQIFLNDTILNDLIIS